MKFYQLDVPEIHNVTLFYHLVSMSEHNRIQKALFIYIRNEVI